MPTNFIKLEHERLRRLKEEIDAKLLSINLRFDNILDLRKDIDAVFAKYLQSSDLNDATPRDKKSELSLATDVKSQDTCSEKKDTLVSTSNSEQEYINGGLNMANDTDEEPKEC